jgi:hypothetical protein
MQDQQGTCAMKRMLVRYKAKPDAADLNQRLIEAVFQELHAKAPDGVQYLVLRLADGMFVHFVQGKTDIIPALDAFKAFSGSIKERCQELPQPNEAVVVGNYRVLPE